MKAKTIEAVTAHGIKLLRLFPQAKEQDPVALCKKLRRLEINANRHVLELCNGSEPGEHGDEWSERHNSALSIILNKVHVLLGNTTQNGCTVPVFINRDPRGYTLKIDSEWMTANATHKAKMDAAKNSVPCTAQHQTFGGRCLSCGFVNQTGEAVRGYGILAPDLTQD